MQDPLAKPVDLKTRIAYGLPALALAMVGVPAFVYLPKFYTDVVGVSMTAFGAIFLGARAFDAITDPAVGFLSDRSRSRWGRRRPWIVLGALPLAGATCWLYIPPAHLSLEGAAIWFGVGVVALFLFWTVIIVPYKSLGPELTHDYDERTTLFAYRESSLVFGTLLAAAGPVAVGAALGLGDSPEDERMRFAAYAVVASIVLIAACVWCARVVKEPPLKPIEPAQPLFKGMRSVLENRPFRILLISYTVIAIGFNLPATLITYFVAYVLKEEGIVAWILVEYFVIGIICLPAWVKLAQKVGKKTAWLGSMTVNTVAFAGCAFLGPGDLAIYVVLVGLSGIGGVAVLVMPSSMQADVIEYDELRVGRRREGAFVGFWSIAEKLAAAFGVGIALPILDAAGYVPNQDQTGDVVWTLKALYVGLPVACNVVGFVIALRYPINRQVHAALLDAIMRRRQGEDVADPLHPQKTIAAPE